MFDNNRISNILNLSPITDNNSSYDNGNVISIHDKAINKALLEEEGF